MAAGKGGSSGSQSQAQSGQTAGNMSNAGITGSSKLIDGTVTTVKLGADSVTSAKILDGTIANADLADGSISGAKIPTGAITTGMVLDGTLLAADHADGSITEPKLDINSAPPGTNKTLYYNVSASKLDYAGTPALPGTCVQTFSTRLAFLYASGAQTLYASPVDAGSTTSGTDTVPPPLQTAAPYTFGRLTVKAQSGTASRATTFKIWNVGVAPAGSITCTVAF